MFKNQLKVIEKTAQYLDSKKEAGIEAFRKLTAKCQNTQPEFVLFMMPHENLETYLKIGEQWELYDGFEGLISHDELERLQRYDYNEEKVHEDYMYWETSSLMSKIFEMWLSHCFHTAKSSAKLDIPFYYMSVPESVELFYLNECQVKLNKKAYNEQHELNLKFNVVDLGL